MSEKRPEVSFDFYDCTKEGYVILKIREHCEPSNRNTSMVMDARNARIIAAAFDLYKALEMDNDFITPIEVSTKACMDALDKAEGAPKGTRWDRYWANYVRSKVVPDEQT